MGQGLCPDFPLSPGEMTRWVPDGAGCERFRTRCPAAGLKVPASFFSSVGLRFRPRCIAAKYVPCEEIANYARAKNRLAGPVSPVASIYYDTPPRDRAGTRLFLCGWSLLSKRSGHGGLDVIRHTPLVKRAARGLESHQRGRKQTRHQLESNIGVLLKEETSARLSEAMVKLEQETVANPCPDRGRCPAPPLDSWARPVLQLR